MVHSHCSSFRSNNRYRLFHRCGRVQFARVAALVLMCGLTSVCAAFGAAINIPNTGVGPGGTALPVGQLDPNYSLISAPTGVPLTAITTIPNGGWTPNTSTADWIGPTGNGEETSPAGNYDYRINFDLTGLDPTTATLSGNWTSDNNGCIDLNGVNTGICTGVLDYGTLMAFSITSGFQPGINTLDFLVTNTVFVGTNPTGVIVEISGTAAPSAAPEPSSLVLVAIGLTALLGVIRRRVSLISLLRLHTGRC